MSPRGCFIAFEGGEGAGKSTQARLLSTALEAQGIGCVVTREPGGTPGAEAIRRLLLDPALPRWGARAEALLFAAARSDHVANLIRPALAEGRWVICDRFVDSSRAYQGAAGELGDRAIVLLHDLGSDGLLPDRTILLEVPEGEVGERLEVRDAGEADKIGGRDTDYHRAVADAFGRLAEAEPERFVRIDGSGSEGEVHRRIVRALAPLIGEAGR